MVEAQKTFRAHSTKTIHVKFLQKNTECSHLRTARHKERGQGCGNAATAAITHESEALDRSFERFDTEISNFKTQTLTPGTWKSLQIWMNSSFMKMKIIYVQRCTKCYMNIMFMLNVWVKMRQKSVENSEDSCSKSKEPKAVANPRVNSLFPEPVLPISTVPICKWKASAAKFRCWNFLRKFRCEKTRFCATLLSMRSYS